MDKNKETLLKPIKDFYQREGKVPGKREISTYPKIIRHFGSWTNAITAAGLEPSIKFWTKESILERIEEWFEEKGSYPKYSDLKKENNMFDHRVFKRHIGQTYNSYMISQGKISSSIRYSHTILDEMSDDDVLQLFKDEIHRINTNNSNVYKMERSEGSPSYSYLKKRFNCTWNTLMQLIGRRGIVQGFDKVETLKLFEEFVATHNYVPTLNELEKKERSIYNGIQANWARYKDFCDDVGVEPPFVKPDAVTASDEDLLTMYYEYYLELGRVPTSKDLDNSDEIYNYDVYALRFDTIDNVRRLSGVPEINQAQSRITKEDVERAMLSVYRKYGRVTNKRLAELLPMGLTTVCRKYKTTKISDVWTLIEEKSKHLD